MPRISKSYNEDADRDSIRDMFWSAGIKATKPRMAIVKTLESEKHPVSVTELQKKLSKASKASKASVYRTLEALVDSGDVSRIDTGSPHASYEIVDGRKHHHHLICKKCGDMEDIETGKDCMAGKVEHLALSKSGKFKSVDKHSLEFFGLCKKCA